MSEILESVLKEFEEISKIPRPSKHEEKVADYLVKRLISLGLKAHKDEIGNVIAELSASNGLENLPLTIMQAHMDMVCVSESNKSYDPLTDSIKLLRDENYLKADGTSLGADDGIGIAIILYILSNQKIHGKQRIIFTVDEETGMSGASGLDEKYLSDAHYLINVDSENFEELVVGSAGSLRIDLNRQINWTETTKTKAFRINIAGLKGGHSGEAIGIKHTNAIKIICRLLGKLDCEIASISGGRAMNVIPSESEAIITTDKNDVHEICTALRDSVADYYEEPKLKIDVNPLSEAPKQVMSLKDKTSLLTVVDCLFDGLYNSKNSANIGVLNIVNDEVQIKYMPRFHEDVGQSRMMSIAKMAAEKSSYILTCGEATPPWESKEPNHLAVLMLEAAQSQGRQLKQRVIHGGLECSYFIQKNPNLDIVSVGTTNIDIHSPKEKLLLSSVEPTVNLIMKAIQNIN